MLGSFTLANDIHLVVVSTKREAFQAPFDFQEPNVLADLAAKFSLSILTKRKKFSLSININSHVDEFYVGSVSFPQVLAD